MTRRPPEPSEYTDYYGRYVQLVPAGDIVTATIAHLARSTPERFCFTATDFNSYVTVPIADGAPRRENGFMTASDQPGLGVTPKWDVLGDPVQVIR